MHILLMALLLSSPAPPDYEAAILPHPRELTVSGALTPIRGPACVVKRVAGPTVDYAASELCKDLADRVGLSASVAEAQPAPRAKLVVEITREESEPEGYVIGSRTEGDRLVYTVAGHDSHGILYGTFAVAQAIEEATVAARAPAAPASLSIADAPQMATRLLPTQFYNMSADDPKRTQKLAILDWVARWRLNGVWRGLDASEAELAAYAAETERRGITLFGVLGFLRLRNPTKGSKDVELCASDPSDLAYVRTLFEKGARAGCRGLAFLFDDLPKPMYLHHERCPHCKSRFGSTSEWQLPFIKVAVNVARKHGIEKVIVCPTPYSQGSAQRFADQRYFETLCAPDFMEDVLVFHCDFYTDNIHKLQQRGLRNYIWWNNGLWTTTHYFDGVYMGLPRIFHIWYGCKSGPTTIPEPKPEALESLKRLPEVARHVYPAPTGSFAGKALGGSLAWSPRWTVEHEMTVRRRVAELIFGRDAWPHYSAWESNLLAWYSEARTHSISFDKTKAATHIAASEKALARLAAARDAAKGARAPLQCAQWHAADLLRSMRRSIAQAGDSLKIPDIPPPVPFADDDQAVVPEDLLLWLRFGRGHESGLMDHATKKIHARLHGPGPNLRRGVFDNAIFLEGKENHLEIPGRAADHLNPGAGSLTVECWVLVMGHGWNQFIGKRNTNREIYRSAGYSIGSDRIGHRWRFTIENAAGPCVSVTAPMKKPLHHWHHLVGVRDTANREVRLYVDGQLAKSAPDTTGSISSAQPVRLAWDRMTGFRFWGFLDEVRVWSRARSAEEVSRDHEAGRAALDR